MSKILSVIALAFVGPFKMAILAAWARAQELAYQEIRAGLPAGDGEMGEAELALSKLKPAAVADRKKPKE